MLANTPLYQADIESPLPQITPLFINFKESYRKAFAEEESNIGLSFWADLNPTAHIKPETLRSQEGQDLVPKNRATKQRKYTVYT